MQLHFEAAKHTDSAYDVAWKFIADGVRKDGGVSEAGGAATHHGALRTATA